MQITTEHLKSQIDAQSTRLATSASTANSHTVAAAVVSPGPAADIDSHLSTTTTTLGSSDNNIIHSSHSDNGDVLSVIHSIGSARLSATADEEILLPGFSSPAAPIEVSSVAPIVKCDCQEVKDRSFNAESRPSGRSAMAYTTHNGKLVIMGGEVTDPLPAHYAKVNVDHIWINSNGQYLTTDLLNDTWAFDFVSQKWVETTSQKDGKMQNKSYADMCVLPSVDGSVESRTRLCLFGGDQFTRKSRSLHCADIDESASTVSWEFADPFSDFPGARALCPTGRSSHGLVCLVDSATVMVVGGGKVGGRDDGLDFDGSELLNDVWIGHVVRGKPGDDVSFLVKWDPVSSKSSTPVSVSSPSNPLPRIMGHGMVALGDSRDNQRVVVFGGRKSDGLFNSSVFVGDFSFAEGTISWELLHVQPGSSWPVARQGHSLVQTGPFEFAVFGGWNIDQQSGRFMRLNDLWIGSFSSDFSRFEWRQVEITGKIPSPRSGHAAAYHDNCLYLFGGKSQFKHVLTSEFADYEFDFYSTDYAPPAECADSSLRKEYHLNDMYRIKLH